MILSAHAVDCLAWIPFGAVLGVYTMRRKVTRRIATMLDDALVEKPSPAEWLRIKREIANHRLGLYLGFATIGAMVGACIGGVGYVLIR
jgi:hypothetical protein